MIFMMIAATTLCFGGVTYSLGRVHGYEKSEKDYNHIASKEFWKDVKNNGL